MNPRRLYRSRDRQLAGVAGGMAEYLDVDPTIIRIGWILITIVTGGLALIAYLLLALVIPASPYAAGTPYAGGQWTSQQTGTAWPGQPPYGTQPQYGSQPPYTGQTWSVPPAQSAPQWDPGYVAAQSAPASRGLGAAGIFGILLIVLGGIALADIALPGLRIGLALGPALILALGIGLLVSSIRRPAERSGLSSGTSEYASAPAAPASAAPSTVPSDMTPWPATSAPTASAAADASALDADATQTDIPTVPSSEPPTGDRA